MALTHWEKTKIFTFALAVAAIGIALFFQIRADKDLLINCSYLDPVTVDVLAFFAASFLILEGVYRLYEHRYATFSKQFTRAIRIALGCSILTLHVMQFLHK